MKNIKINCLKEDNEIRKLGFIVAIVLFLWFGIPFLVAGILNIVNVTGMLIAIVAGVYFFFRPAIHIWIEGFWAEKVGKVVLSSIAGIAIVIILLAITETSCILNACMKAPAENATAVVLGCRVYGERASMSLVERLEAAYDYLKEHPNAMCVVSGGQGSGENISEAECMYRWLVDKGIDASRIYKEDKSTSTEENIAFSKEVIQKNGLNEHIVIVTSEYHTYRAGVIAKENGLSFGSAPGHTAIWLFPTFYVRELYAILAEWLF